MKIVKQSRFPPSAWLRRRRRSFNCTEHRIARNIVLQGTSYCRDWAAELSAQADERFALAAYRQGARWEDRKLNIENQTVDEERIAITQLADDLQVRKQRIHVGRAAGRSVRGTGCDATGIKFGLMSPYYALR